MDDSTDSGQPVRRRRAGTGSPLRASDTERENALRALATHFADGRLERSEFDERADTALAARTQPELHALFADLPGPSPVAAVARPEADTVPTSAPSVARRGVPVPGFPLLLLAPVLLVLAVTAVVHGLPPFPLIPLLFLLSRRARHWNREARPWI
jgi:hypothetical protein